MTLVVTLGDDPIAPLPAELEIAERDFERAFEGARAAGWNDAIAGCWAATVAGLDVKRDDGDPIAWTILEVRSLELIRRLVASGRLRGDGPS